VGEKEFQDLLQRIDDNLEACVSTRAQVEGHHRTLFGQDGRSGLVTEFIHVDHKMDDLAASFHTLGVWLRWGIGIMITVGLVTLGILIKHLGHVVGG